MTVKANSAWEVLRRHIVKHCDERRGSYKLMSEETGIPIGSVKTNIGGSVPSDKRMALYVGWASRHKII